MTNEVAVTHERSPEAGWQVFCPRCNTEVKTLKAAPHSEYECINALNGEVKRLTKELADEQENSRFYNGRMNAKSEEIEELLRETETLRGVCDLWGLHKDPEHEINVAKRSAVEPREGS